MTRMIFPLFAAAALTGCSSLSDNLGLNGGTSAPASAPAAQAEPEAVATEDAVTDDAAESAAVENAASAEAQPAAASGGLGETVVSLGSATEPGLWLKTPLVKAEQPGRVTNPATGQSAEVTLIPIPGPSTAGSRMSLSGLQAIGASLTDLTRVQVTAG